MPIKAKKLITRSDVFQRRDLIFVFGDNDQRKGRGGQAYACRGQPNAIGVRLKKTPADHPSAYWSDDDFETNARKIDEDVAAIRSVLEAGMTVVFPKGGLSIGSANLEDVAPRTAAYLRERLASLKTIDAPLAAQPPSRTWPYPEPRM